MTYYLRLLALPLLFLGFFLSLFAIWHTAGLPTGEALTALVENWYGRYGMPILFASSLVEGVLLIGNYFPGAFVIFLGVILAQSPSQAALAITVVIAGLFSAHQFNYALGRWGWYQLLIRFGLKSSIDRSRERLINKGPVAIMLSYWLPNLGAITDTAAGIIRMPYRTFLAFSFVSVVFWSVFFGTVAYVFKDFALFVLSPNTPQNGLVVIVVFTGVWAAIVLISDFVKRRRKTNM